ncbi:MAG: glutamyl-tRNA reductase [Chloroflexi bacterium]|nr:glutamyl-tRNA reductase [Ardenticatenaceae bacterium]NOG36200.1 glutamyl-tRNA reductase [Chloroflexota bacterium]
MMPPILCLGLNHQTAPVSLRERLSCSLAVLAGQMPTAVSELALLSTCNRIELYAVIQPDETATATLLLHLLAQTQPPGPAELADYVYFLRGDTAVNHLLRVASGLDSLVLGEAQILGQVTDAYRTAVAQHTIGPVLDALFKTAIRAGKRARAETTISSNPASVSSVAIALARQALGSLTNRAILVVGIGEMGQLALKALRARELTNVSVANRTKSRAETAVAPFNGRAYSLDELPQAIQAADVVMTAVHSPRPIVDITTILERERPLVIVDIAVPRNVDTAVAALPHVQLFNLDHLQATLDDSLAARTAEIPQVEHIIAAETAQLNTHYAELTVKPLILEMRRKAEQIRETELERALRHLGEVDEQTMAHLQRFSHSLVNKLLHEPTLRLKEKAGHQQAGEYATAVRELFGLPEHLS